MLFNKAMKRGARECDVVLVISHNQASDFLPDAVRQTDDAQLLDVRRVFIDLFELVRINILTIGIDDDLF